MHRCVSNDACVRRWQYVHFCNLLFNPFKYKRQTVWSALPKRN